MIELPIGVSGWGILRKYKSLYVDKTPFVKVLEESSLKYVTFLRPRKFGKSLFMSMLHHYYGVEHQAKFDYHFSGTYIGENPTSFASSYFVLQLGFSGIMTDSEKMTFDGFLHKVKSGSTHFFRTNPTYFSEKDVQEITKIKTPHEVLTYIFNRIADLPYNLYILIDEYDHFAHQILAFHPNRFMDMVGKEGFVRKFYETIKEAAMDNVVEKVFITGISPVTLDSMTSGFNITKSLTHKLEFHDMLGFTKAEVLWILQKIGMPDKEIPKTLRDLTAWYDGYLFHKKAKERLYNSNMIMYFAEEYASTGEYPSNLLDINIASDYSKIRLATQLGNIPIQNNAVLQTLIEQGEIAAELTEQYSFEKPLKPDDFISFLYYMGLLTLKKEKKGEMYFKIPNVVIQKLYYDFFREILLFKEKDGDVSNHRQINEAISLLCYDDMPQPIVTQLCLAIHKLSVRDTKDLSESHIKAMLISFLSMGRVYYIKSEYEIDRKFLDVLLLKRPPFDMPYNVALELKYLPKSRESEFETVKAEAIEQVKGYLAMPELEEYPDLRTYLIVIVGEECRCLEKIIIP